MIKFEMTQQEMARVGNETISYYDHAVNGYVTTRGSIEFFIELIGQESNEQAVRDMLFPCGHLSVHTVNNGVVSIDLMGKY